MQSLAPVFHCALMRPIKHTCAPCTVHSPEPAVSTRWRYRGQTATSLCNHLIIPPSPCGGRTRTCPNTSGVGKMTLVTPTWSVVTVGNTPKSYPYPLFVGTRHRLKTPLPPSVKSADHCVGLPGTARADPAQRILVGSSARTRVCCDL